MTALQSTRHSAYNIEDKFFLIPEALSAKIGYEESLILTRIQYWVGVCGKSLANENGLWIYNSQNEWKKQFPFFSLYKIKKIIRSLEGKGILISKKANAKKCNHTKWYSIDFDKLNDLVKPVKSMCKKIYSKSTNRLVENQLIYKEQKNNYTNKTSSIVKKQESDKKIVDEKVLEEDLFEFKDKRRSDDKPKSLVRQETTEKSSETSALTYEEMCIVKEMISVWNEEFRYSLKPIKAFCNKKTEKLLLNLYVQVFDSDIEKWRNYALMVNSSKFLMGEKEAKNSFKAVFSWLIKEDVVLEVLSGGYGVGDRELDKNNLSRNIEKKKEEIISHTNKKISEYIKSNILEEKERGEFNEYVLNEQYRRDGDVYKIKDMLSIVSPMNLIYNSTDNNGYKMTYKSLYDSYISKKYFGMTPIELKNATKSTLANISENNTGAKLFEILEEVKNKIYYMDLYNNSNEINKCFSMFIEGQHLS